MRILFAIVSLCLSVISHAGVDSLEIALKKAVSPDEKLDLLFQLTKYYNRRDKEKTDSIFKAFEEIYLETEKNEKYSGKYYNIKGNIYVREGDSKQAISSYEKAIPFYEKQEDYQNLWNVYNDIGSTYDDIGNLGNALASYLKSMEVAENHLDEGAVAGTSINIGVIYAMQEMFEEALFYFKKSRDYHQKFGASWGLGNNLNNIGQVYSLKEESDSALAYFTKALDVWKEVGDNEGIAMTVHNLGALYLTMEDFENAEKYLKESLRLCFEMDEQYGITLNLTTLGSLYSKSGQKEKVLEILNKGLDYAVKNGLVPLQKNQHLQLYNYFKEIENYKEALKHYEAHFVLYDSINNESAIKNLKEIQTKYDTEKKQAELIQQKAELVEKDLMLSESKNRVMILSFASLGFILIIVFVVVNLRQKHKANQLIAKQKEEVENQKYIVEEKNKEITDSITYAKRIQAAILPPARIVKEYLQDSFILYKPKDIVAGDFYWMETSVNPISKQDVILFAAADCTGHGVPGAMVSVICNSGLNRSVREYGITDPGKILDKTREIVIQEFEKSEEEVKDGMDIALCSLELVVPGSELRTQNSKSGTVAKLQYAGANNPLWVIRNNASEVEEIKANKEPIGSFFEQSPYITHTVDLQKGDTIYIFSDGYADQFGGERGKKFKAINFKRLLLSIQDESMEQRKKAIERNFDNWKGNFEQIDDVCIIGVRI